MLVYAAFVSTRCQCRGCIRLRFVAGKTLCGVAGWPPSFSHVDLLDQFVVSLVLTHAAALGNRGQFEIGVMGYGADFNDPDSLTTFLAANPQGSYPRVLGLRESRRRRSAGTRPRRVGRRKAQGVVS